MKVDQTSEDIHSFDATVLFCMVKRWLHSSWINLCSTNELELNAFLKSILLNCQRVFLIHVWKRYMYTPYTPQYFLHPDQLIHGGKPINALFDKFKGEDTFFVSEWLRQKGQEKLWDLTANINFVYCMTKNYATVNTLRKRFHCDEKILMWRSLVVCLSFTTCMLNTFENKKVVIKILVYSSVIDINHINVIFLQYFITWNFGDTLI